MGGGGRWGERDREGERGRQESSRGEGGREGGTERNPELQYIFPGRTSSISQTLLLYCSVHLSHTHPADLDEAQSVPWSPQPVCVVITVLL